MATQIQRSLASGELSPALRRRRDLQRIDAAARTIRNFFVRKNGGASNRGGTSYVYGAPGEDTGAPIGAQTILVPWSSPNSPDSYVLEFGNGFIRFTKNGSMVTVDTIADWAIGTAYTIGDLAADAGVYYYCKVAHTGHQPPNATYWYALSGYEYSIPTPYTTGLLIDRGAFSFAQDSNRMLITHGSVIPHELVRVSDTRWTLTPWDVDSSSPTRYGIPRVNPPATLTAITASTKPDTTYGVTALTDDLEESLPITVICHKAETAGTVALSWPAATFIGTATGNIKGYNIYRMEQGILFYLGFTNTLAYTDDATVIPSTSGDSPPETRSELATNAGTYPKKVGTFEGRTILGNFSFNIQAGYASRIGFRQNFTRRFPAADDDSILFQLRGKQQSGIRHFVDIGSLIAFADSGEWVIQGNANGALTPSTNSPKQYGYNGASGDVWPVVVGSRAVYVQAEGSLIRSLGFENQGGGLGGFIDEDLTAFADHLFQGYNIVSMAYQKTPHSIVWAVRDDGKLLGLTYLRDQQILAWHHHDTDGFFEDVCCIPENGTHALYAIVRRNIGGFDFRYMERMNDRDFTDVADVILLDCALTYDGRNTGAQTMTLSGGTNWDENENLTLTSDVIFFSALEIGNQMWLTGTDGKLYRFNITGCTSDYIVTVVPVQTIPAGVGIRDTAITTWARAVDTLSGLDHLEGKDVGVFANGNVLASPNNDQYPVFTVASGSITLDECFSYAHVGLPYLSDIETLDRDSLNSETVLGKNMINTAIAMDVQDTRGLFAGPKPPSDDSVDPLERLTEIKGRDSENYSEPNALINDIMEVNIDSEWNGNGRVFIRQVDPLPVTILSIAPSGLTPFKPGGA